MPLFASIWLALQSLFATPTAGVITAARLLPPPASAWAGDAPHHFLEDQVVLFCGSHGLISGSFDPPHAQNDAATLHYSAQFTGELLLSPPLVSTPQRHAIHAPIQMTERVVANGRRGTTERFDTELLALDFEPSGLPTGILVREARLRRSEGQATISKRRDGRFHIKSTYQVWLEVSVDRGRSWHLADKAVTMNLGPDPAAAGTR